MIGAIATFIVSCLLIHGIRTVSDAIIISLKILDFVLKKKSSYILPWIIETVIQTCGTFIMFLVRVTGPDSISAVKVSLLYFNRRFDAEFLRSIL